jgi:hypothetical protein
MDLLPQRGSYFSRLFRETDSLVCLCQHPILKTEIPIRRNRETSGGKVMGGTLPQGREGGQAMSTLQAARSSREHWERMIAWVKTRPVDERAYIPTMSAAIGEWWGGEHCSLCQEVVEKNACDCTFCILAQMGSSCQSNFSPYGLLKFAETWGAWLIHAEALLDILKKAERKLEQEAAQNQEHQEGAR